MKCPENESVQEWIQSLSAKQLKEYITERGLTYSDCLEKTDLQKRALEAASGDAGDLKNEPPLATARSPISQQVQKTQMKFANYQCDVFAKGKGAGPVDFLLIMLHGYCATNADFEFLPQYLSTTEKLKRQSFVAVIPQATGFPPQWWELDILEFVMAQRNEAKLAELIRQVPKGLGDAREALLKLIAEARDWAGNVPSQKVVLAGFSQGAMTAMDIALHMPQDQRVAGVCMLSGAPIVVEEWAVKAASHQGLPVLITHGLKDMVIPYVASTWVSELLKLNGLEVRRESHPGSHELGPPSILLLLVDCIAKWIR